MNKFYKNECKNCKITEDIWIKALSYRCSECKFINCLVCNKTHDNACDLFNRKQEKSSAPSKSLEVTQSTPKGILKNANTPKKESEESGLKRRISVNPKDDKSSKIKKRRLSEPSHDTFCHVCGIQYSSKRSLHRHEETLKHKAKVAVLDVKKGEPEDIERASSDETIPNE